MFLSSEDEGDHALTLKKPHKERARSPTPEVVAVEPTPAHRRKGRVNALVAKSDKVPQSVAKHGYPEHAYLLGWLIYKGHDVLKRPAKCGRCIRDRQGCVAAEEYVAKDDREPEVKERGSKGKSKGKVKDKGLATGSSLISSKGVLGTRTSTLAGEERMEELVDRSGDLMRDVSVKLNELLVKLSALNGAVLELEGVQATIRKLMK
ncbi:hypothetical protein JB92DRAFT_3145252 [Gautieria morchelliformis]|nr:hypothetical protein JB92DRAFT_3145252 [Gautieria morchelliformis]